MKASVRVRRVCLIRVLMIWAGRDGLGYANIQNTTIYARLTTATLDAQTRMIFASHRVV